MFRSFVVAVFHVAVLLIGPGIAAAQVGEGPDGADAAAAFDDAFDDFDEGFAEDSKALVFSGFVELGYGRRLDADPLFESRQTLGDLRGRVETEWAGDRLSLTIKGDALYDEVRGESDLKMRELSLRFSPGGAVDLKLGRQVLTWGTGDLLFLNDLFPKSWVSFFSGRDDEYLKAASDAVRATWYGKRVNVDVVWSPSFEPDEYLTGQRFSFFSPLAGAIVAPNPPLAGVEPRGDTANGELAVRLFRTVGATEFAGYAYRGYFKRPLGLSPNLEQIFPRLNVVGGSLRRPLGQGLINAEFAWHDSREDHNGTDPFLPNDQLRILVGYEFEARPRFNVAFQYYQERISDFGALMANSLAPEFEPDRARHLLTNRLTWRSARDTLTLSLFTFYSPSDSDFYLRPGVSFRQSDQWTFVAGANLFGGELSHTFFGQLEDNSNAWFRVRFSY